MDLSGEFRNKARCALVMTPTMLATIASIYVVGPTALLPVVMSAAIAYPALRAISNLGHNRDLLTRMELSERWKEIASNMGFKEVPPVYRLESEDENAYAGYGNIVMSGKLLDNYNQDEIDDTFAHELAHIKRLDGMIVPTGRAAALMSVIPVVWHLYNLVFFNNGSSQDLTEQGMAFISFGIATGLTIPLMSDSETMDSNYKKEFDCDERAVMATGNIDAGTRALRHFDDMASSSHPSTFSRISNLKRLKKTAYEGRTP